MRYSTLNVIQYHIPAVAGVLPQERVIEEQPYVDPAHKCLRQIERLPDR